MKSKILALGVTMLAAGPALAADDLHEIARRHTIDSICYEVGLQVSRLADRHVYPKLKVPFCVNLSKQYSPDAISCHADGTCIYKPQTERFVTVKSTFHFAALYQPFGYSVSWDRVQPDWILTLQGSIFTNWDYRMNQLIASVKDQLPVRLGTLLVPSTGEVEDLSLSVLSTGGELKVSGNWLNRLSAIGFDDEGREHQLDVTFGLDARDVIFQSIP